MQANESRGLVSQEMREMIREGSIVNLLEEDRIQPASFDPGVGDELYVIETETKGLFHPDKGKTVYRTLLELPRRRRQKANISDGYELKIGFTYLVPLLSKVRLSENEFLKSSPKSSLGRIFFDTRLVADYNDCLDFATYNCCGDSEISLWLLVQPLAFNAILHPGISLNQLRFSQGLEAKLSPTQIKEGLAKQQILYRRNREGEIVNAEQIVTDGLELHIDLSGEHTEGIVGLRARHNPTPIDLREKGKLKAEDFFEPLKAEQTLQGEKTVTLGRGEYCLFASHEILRIPPHLCAELESYSETGFRGPLHFAGFIDNGFNGDLVFEVRSEEERKIELKHGKPISKLQFYRTNIPDKIYGQEIGSNYQMQIGVRPAKYFGPFDFSFAARTYQKLDKITLCQIPEILLPHHNESEGFQLLQPDEVHSLIKDAEDGFWHSRYDCEGDPEILQPIPYIILFGPDESVFSYVRTKKITEFGERRLFNKISVAVGGHILQEDGPRLIATCANREITEEVNIDCYSPPELVGTMWATDKEVDNDHFGLIFKSHTNGKIERNEESIAASQMFNIDYLVRQENLLPFFETWSRKLLPHLKDIYNHNGMIIR